MFLRDPKEGREELEEATSCGGGKKCHSAESEPQQEAAVGFEVVFLLTWEKQLKRVALVSQAGDVGGKTQSQLSLDVLRFTPTASPWCWRQHGQQTVLTTAHLGNKSQV